MKTIALLLAVMLFASVAVRGQGVFFFANRSAQNSARFVLSTDTPGTLWPA